MSLEVGRYVKILDWASAGGLPRLQSQRAWTSRHRDRRAGTWLGWGASSGPVTVDGELTAIDLLRCDPQWLGHALEKVQELVREPHIQFGLASQ